jgi:response regulator NasT
MVGSKIFLASQDTALRKRLKNMLSKNSYNVVGEAGDAISALRLIRAMGPDLVIVDFELQGMPAMDLIKIIEEDRIAPVIIIASTWERELVEKNRQSWIFAFLVRPIDERNLLAAADSALMNFERMLILEKEVAKLKDTLETRKVVEKAKGLLMEKLALTELEAFRKIQHQSMDKGIPMKQVADAIILTYDIGTAKRKR